MKSENGLEIEGLTTTESKEDKEDNTLIDDILENTRITQEIEDMLSKEASERVGGVYSQTLIYNKPVSNRTAPDKGKIDWGIRCDKMLGGCPYKARKESHTHIIGINIRGAEEAMRAYRKLEILINDEPKITKVDNKEYWLIHAEAHDLHTGNKLSRWYSFPVMMRAGSGFIFNENALQIAQSKLLRNIILAMVAGSIQEKWINQYLEGATSFSTPEFEDIEEPQNSKYSNADEFINRIHEFDNAPALVSWGKKHGSEIKLLQKEQQARVRDAYAERMDIINKASQIEKPIDDATQSTTDLFDGKIHNPPV